MGRCDRWSKQRPLEHELIHRSIFLAQVIPDNDITGASDQAGDEGELLAGI